MNLVDQYGRPIKTGELQKEIAAPTLAGVRSIWNDSVASGLTPERLASLLQAAADGDHDSYLTLAEEMEERDLHYSSVLRTRKLAVSRLPIVVEASSDEKRDQELADAVRAMVRRSGFRGMLKDLLDAFGKGFSVSEIMWDRTGARWEPGRYEWRDPHFFQFDLATRRELRLRDEADLMNGLPLTPYKFIAHTPRFKSGIPIRGGFARLAGWAFMCKGYGLKDWLAFAEVFGMPWRIGKYGTGASKDDIHILKMALANLGSDAAAAIPESMKIELVEAAKAGGGESFFERLADWFDRQISKGVLGQTMTTDDGSSRAQAQVHDEVRSDIRDDDAEQLEETLNRDLVKPYIDLNFGPQENYPQLLLQTAEPEDIATLSEALAKLVPLGLEVGMSTIRDKMGLPDPDPDEEILTGRPPAAGTETPPPVLNRRSGKALNAQRGDIDAVDGMAERAAEAAPEEPLINAVYRILQDAGSFEEVAGRLDELKDLPLDKLTDNLAQAMAAANLAGRSGVEDGN